MARPNGHVVDVQHVPLATRLLLPSLYSRRAYRLVDNVAILKSASGVVGIEKVVGEIIKPQVGLFIRGHFLCNQKTANPPLCTREKIQ